MQIIFRTMTLADVAKVHEIETHSFKTAWSLEDFQQCMASARHIKIIAELEEKISAYAVIQFLNDRNFYLLKFVVAPEFRRHGLGKIFLETLLKFICKRGGATMNLHVSTKNIAAIRLYESCGFKVFERIENFYNQDNENAFTMERKI